MDSKKLPISVPSLTHQSSSLPVVSTADPDGVATSLKTLSDQPQRVKSKGNLEKPPVTQPDLTRTKSKGVLERPPQSGSITRTKSKGALESVVVSHPESTPRTKSKGSLEPGVSQDSISRTKSKGTLEPLVVAQADVTPRTKSKGTLDPGAPHTDAAARTKSLPDILNPQYFEAYSPEVRWCYTTAKVVKDENAKWLPYSDEENEYFETMYQMQKGGVVLRMGKGRLVDIKKRTDANKKIGAKDYKMIRGTWFYESAQGGFTPYPEKVAMKLETEFSAGSTKVQVSQNPLRFVEILQNTFRQYRNSTHADRNGRCVRRGHEGRLALLSQPFKEFKLFPLPLKETKPIESAPLSDTRSRIIRLKTFQQSLPPKTIEEIEREKNHTEIIKRLQEDCAKYRNEIRELRTSLQVYENNRVEQQQKIKTLHEELGKEVDVALLQEKEIKEKEEIIMKLMERLKNFTGQEKLVEPGEFNFSDHYEEVKVLKELAEDVNEQNKSNYITALKDTYKDCSPEELKDIFSDILKD